MRFWDARAARITLTVASIAALLYGLYAVRRTLFVFLLAIFLAYMVQPLVRLLERLRPPGVPRWTSPVVAMSAVVLVVAVIIAVVGGPIGEQATRLVDQLPDLSRRAAAVDSWPWPSFLQPYAERIVDFLRTEVQGGAAQALPIVRRVGSGVVKVAGDLLLVVLVPILAFLFLVNGPKIQTTLQHVLARRPTERAIVDDLHHVLGRYIRALLLLSVIAFVAYALFLGLAGVPYGLLLAGIAGILEFVPVFGPLLATLVILIVAALAGYDHILWIVIFIAAYRVFQDYVLGPRLMGAEAGVHPILVLFGLLAGEELGGIPGIFVSVPVLAAALIIGQHVMRARLPRPARGDG